MVIAAIAAAIREGDQPEFELTQVQVGLQIIPEHSEDELPEIDIQCLARTSFYSKMLLDFRWRNSGKILQEVS